MRRGICLSLLLLISSYPRLVSAQDPSKSAAKIESLWNDLADADATNAYRAIMALTKIPKGTVAFLAASLEPALAPDAKMVDGLLQDLSSETFAVREKASKELIKIGDLAEPSLRKALAADPTPEAKQRLEKIIDRLTGPITTPDGLQAVRAVEALENIGGEAKSLLAKYAAGAPGALLTREATQALQRLAKSKPSPIPTNPPRTDLFGDGLPEGAVGRLGTIRFRRDYQGLTIREGLAFIDADKAIVSYPLSTNGMPMTRDNGVQIWEIPSGRLLRSLATGPLRISACAVSAEGKLIAVACNSKPINIQRPSEIRIFDLLAGELVQSFTYKSGGMTHNLALSADGKTLFSLRSGDKGRPDSFVQIEDIATGKTLFQKKYPSTSYTKMILSGDSKCLAVITNNRELFLWNWQTAEPHTLNLDLQTKVVSSSALGGINYSPDGKLFAMVEGTGTLYVWEMPAGRLRFKQESVLKSATYAVPAFTADGKTLAWVTRDKAAKAPVMLLDTATGQQKALLKDSASIYSQLAFSADGKTLAVNNHLLRSAVALQLWDVSTRKRINTDEGHTAEPQQLLVSSKGIVASAGAHEMRAWDSVTSKSIGKIPLNNLPLAFALSPNGNLMAWMSTEDAVHVFDTTNGQEAQRLKGHGPSAGKKTLGFTPDGLGLYSFGNDFQLRLWDMKTGKLLADSPIRPHGVKFPEDGIKMISFGISSGTSPIFSPDGKCLLIGMGEKYYLFDTASGKEMVQYDLNTRSATSKMDISPGSKYLLSRASGVSMVDQPLHSLLSLTELATGKMIQRWQLPGAAAAPVAFSPDGRMFATTADETQKAILIFEIASGNIRHTIGGLPSKVASLAFFPDGKRLASGMGDSTILIWELQK